MAEPIEMPIGGFSLAGPRIHLLGGVQISKEEGHFGGYPAHWKAMQVTHAVYAAKKINNGIGATAAAEVADIQSQLTTHLSTTKGWKAELVGWPIADGLPT